MKSHRVAGFVWTAAVLFLLSPLLTPMAEAQVNPNPKLPAKPYPPTPRLPDGSPNLGPTEPNKGYWHLAQFQDYAKVLLTSEGNSHISRGQRSSRFSAGRTSRIGIPRAIACHRADRG